MNNQEKQLRFMLKVGEVDGLLEAIKLIKQGFSLEGVKLIAELKNKELEAELLKHKLDGLLEAIIEVNSDSE